MTTSGKWSASQIRQKILNGTWPSKAPVPSGPGTLSVTWSPGPSGTPFTTGSYTGVTFNASSTVTVQNGPPRLNFEYLIIGGGAGGLEYGSTCGGLPLPGGGGGGAGAYLTGSVICAPGTYTVQVGAGGAGPNYYYRGGTSIFRSSPAGSVQVVAPGGTEYFTYIAYTFPGYGNRFFASSPGGTTGQGSSSPGGQVWSPLNSGNPGGASSGPGFGGGGGGGSGGPGSNAPGTAGGPGGAGTPSSITGTSVPRAGGGGGAGNTGAGGTGSGGGGNGANIPSAGTAGAANTGGGGGGGSAPAPGSGYNGGSGVVILRWLPS